MARQYYKDSTTGQMKPLGVKVEDTLPVGTIVEYNGQNIPEGWVDIGNGKIEKEYQVIPTNAKLENGDSTSATNGYTADYINNHSVVVSSVEPSGSARKKVWKQHSHNYFNQNEAVITNGYFDSSTGALVSGGGSYVTENYTEVEPNKTYKVNLLTFQRVVYYNASKGVISVYTTGTYFTTPANTKYIRIQSQTNTNGIVIQEGQETIEDKEYILNDNNVYEEFAPQNEVYSTEEVRIGTYLGKPLYRKVFIITNPSSTNTDYVNVSNLNIDDLVHLYGSYKANGIGKFPIPLVDSNTNFAIMFISAGNYLRGRVSTASDIEKVHVTLEYTKTTD